MSWTREGRKRVPVEKQPSWLAVLNASFCERDFLPSLILVLVLALTLLLRTETVADTTDMYGVKGESSERPCPFP